jgi:hypothetical protein
MVARVAAQTNVPSTLAGQGASVTPIGRRRGPRSAEGRALARARRAVAVAAGEVAEADVVAALAVGVGAPVAGFCCGGRC